MTLPTNMSLLRDSQSVKDGLLLDFPLDNAKKPLYTRVSHGTPVFTRNSIGTYLGEDGLIHKAGKNLLVRSEDLSNAAWTKNLTTIAIGAAFSPDGLATANLVSPTTDNNYHSAYQSVTATAEQHVISMHLKAAGETICRLIDLNVSYAGVTFDLENGIIVSKSAGWDGDIEALGDGWYRCSAYKTFSAGTCAPAVVLRDAVQFAGNPNNGIYVWGIQFEVGTIPTAYAKTIDSTSGALRIDYDYEGNCLGALLEGLRTNLATNSEVSPSGVYLTLVSNVDIAPDGAVTADRYYDTADNNYHSIDPFKEITGISNGTILTFSQFVRYGGSRWIQFLVKGKDGVYRGKAFDLLNGVMGVNYTTGGPVDAGITLYPNGWLRIWVSVNVGTGASNPKAAIYRSSSNSATANTFVGTVTNYFSSWGTQVEIGAFPSSYIPTGASTVTREVEALYIQAAGNIKTDAGSAFAEGSTFSNDATGYKFLIWSGGWPLLFNTSESQVLSYDGTNFCPTFGTTGLVQNKAVSAWSGTTQKVCANGHGVASATYSGKMSTDTIILFGTFTGNGYPLFGHIKDVKIWDHALTDSEMQYVTEWPLDYGIIFEVPFDNPSMPLLLNKGTADWTFTRTTTATFINPVTGLITQAASGQLRIEKEGALIEGQRTNVCPYSEDFTTGWTAQAGVTVTANNTTAPDGTSTADRINAVAGTGSHQVYQGVSHADGAVHSIFAKAGTTPWIGLAFGSDPTVAGAFFNLSTGAIGTVTGVTARMKAVGNGWYRCSIYISGAAPYFAFGIFSADNQGLSWNAAGTETLYVWGAQAEVGLFETSYIPTAAAAVTRNADELNLVKGELLSNKAASVVAEFDTNQARSLTPIWAGIIDIDGNPPLAVIQNDATPIGAADGTNYPNGPTGFSAADLSIKAVAVWNGVSTKLGADGLLGTPVSYDGSWGTNLIYIGNRMGGYPLFGHVRKVRFFNRVLSDNSMIRLTQ